MARGLVVIICALLLGGCATYAPPPAAPRVGVPPGQARKLPAVTLLAPIRYHLIPGTSIYYVEGVSPEVFYVAGNFYVQWEGAWHSGPEYHGPWSPVPPGDLPSSLRNQTPLGLKRRLPPS